MAAADDTRSLATPTMRELGLAGVLAATALFWWTTTDRLDLPKQAVLLLGAVACWTLCLVRRRSLEVDWVSAALLAAPVGVLIVAPGEAAARVEGWAGWVAATALFLVARRASVRGLLAPLTALALGIAIIAVTQSLGATWFGAGLPRGNPRYAIGPMGGPAHCGWMLAMLLPWAGTQLLRLRRRWGIPALLIIVAALVLTGSRTSLAAAALSLPAWVPWDGRRVRTLLLLACALALGALLAVGVDRYSDRSRLSDRIDDLHNPRGSARGRIYIWRVHLHALPSAVGLGGGPEAFVRRWPGWQRAFLADHPDRHGFHSDLRHAHADLVEILVDFGLPGLALALWLLFRAVRRRPDEASIRGPPLGCLVALGVAGLAEAPLFFAPSLALGAVCLGLRLGPTRPTTPWLRAVPLVVLLVAAIPLTRRLGSEVHRSSASWWLSHREPERAYERALDAVRWDGRNPRAWILLALAQQRLGHLPSAIESLRLAQRDLPMDSLHVRADRIRRWWRQRVGKEPRPRRRARRRHTPFWLPRLDRRRRP